MSIQDQLAAQAETIQRINATLARKDKRIAVLERMVRDAQQHIRRKDAHIERIERAKFDAEAVFSVTDGSHCDFASMGSQSSTKPLSGDI